MADTPVESFPFPDAPATDAPASDAPSAPTQELTATTEADASSAVAGAADAAAKLGGDYAPIIAIVLAGVAVLGSGKVISALNERGERKAELEKKKLDLSHAAEMKRLDVESQRAGQGDDPPEACKVSYAKIEAEVAQIQGRLKAVEKKTFSMSADFDGEELERVVKKLTRDVAALKEKVP